MPCYRPIRAYQGEVNENGKRPIVFRKQAAALPVKLDLPCRKCVGCHLDYAKQWAIRCVHEASLYDESSFVTLTYRDGEMPPGENVKREEVKRFLERVEYRRKKKVRYFFSGEYGELNGRPHYHGVLFDVGFDDKYVYRVRDGYNYYRSDELEELWDKGHSEIADVTEASAGYIARYCLKKTGEKEEGSKDPEFLIMSTQPGIGKRWLEKYSKEVYPSDTVVLGGKLSAPPKYYDRQFEKVDEVLLRKLKLKRAEKARRGDKEKSVFVDGKRRIEVENSLLRKDVKEKLKTCQIEVLKREI